MTSTDWIDEVIDTAMGNGQEPEHHNRYEAALLTTVQVLDLPPPAPLVGSYLVQDSLAVLYGPAGVGKTFGAVDLGLHVATGTWWHGHPVEARPVLYVIAEGAAGIGRRIDAWATHHQLTEAVAAADIIWLPRAVDLFDGAAVDELGEVLVARRPGLVVFDTLARCMVGGEENSARDVGIVVNHLDQLRRICGACMLPVHHTGVAEQNRARGSSALRAAVDSRSGRRAGILTGCSSRVRMGRCGCHGTSRSCSAGS